MKSSRVTTWASLLVWAALVPTGQAAVFQYAVAISTDAGQREAFLWIPPEARVVRGIVLAGMTLAERELVKDERIRRACADEQLAIAFLKCGLGSADIQRVLDDLADVSGYQELSGAPLLFIGHSAGGPQARKLAIAMAARCFGLVQYRGGVPGGDPPVPPGLPVLMMIGQFDEFGGTMREASGRETWEGGRDALAAFRALDERNLASLVVEPGAGHFAWSERNADYLALFLRKAARARIGPAPGSSSSGAARLIEIDSREGWLTDLKGIGRPDATAPARWGEYPGERSEASWHFDREMADATVAYHAQQFGKKDQFLRWSDPYWVDAGARFFFTKLDWVAAATFRVHPQYADVYPSQYDGRGPRWPDAGKPVGHSNAPIRVRQVGGPVVAVGPDAFRMQYDALAPVTEPTRVTFLACSDGDREYRYAEHVGMMPRGFAGLTAGQPQTIDFPPLANLRSDSGRITMRATSDAGLPVEYYVACGPAEIIGGTLKISGLPARAKYPLEVKVVAWQFGSAIPPLVRSAAPVERTFQILRDGR